MRPSSRPLRHPVAKVLVFAACLGPLIWLGAQFPDGLGANPIEALNRFTGDWALRFLIITLAVSPIARIKGLTDLVRMRRMFGLFAFFYAALHLSSYVGLDQFFAWGAIFDDIVKRNFITIGIVTFLLLLPLAITSTGRMIRRLGARRWKRLHRAVYVAAGLAVVHYWMMTKADFREPAIYGAIVAALLIVRLLGKSSLAAIRARLNALRPGPTSPAL